MKQSLLTISVLTVLLGLDVKAQDRVILFESSRVEGTSILPGEIREVEVAHRGRAWSIRRTLAIPAHPIAGSPVAVADGRRIVWLVREGSTPLAPTFLAQYDLTTGRASVIDAGRFEAGAFLVADPQALRIVVVESERFVSVDGRFQRTAFPLPSPKKTVDASVVGGRLFLWRRTPGLRLSDDELAVMSVDTGATEGIFRMAGTRKMAIRRDGQRFYRAYYDVEAADHRIDLMSASTGEVLVRRSSANPSWIFTVDEARNVVLYDESASGRQRLVLLNADTLVPIGELAPGMFDQRKDFALSETPTERAIVVFSREIVPGYLDDCRTSSPRIDVLDGATFGLIQRMDLERRCPVVIPLPPVTR